MSRSNYVGNGVAVDYSTGFYFLKASEVVVRLTPSGGVEVVQTLGVHYTLVMPAAVGAVGSVHMLVAPPNLSALVVERTVPYTQTAALRVAGDFSPEVHEDMADEIVFQTQQLARRVSDLESAGAVGAVVAGNGLSFAATTLHVGAGNGIQANADTVEVLYGAAGAMVAVTKAAADAGVANTAARIDHKHDVSTAVVGAIAIGDAAAEGVATSLARSDHRHSLAAPAAPADVTKAAAAAGASTAPARADHKHDVSTAAAIALTDATNAEGVATSLARSDHTHAHGNRAGGALHANAVSGGAAGFQSGADKALLDALVARSHASAKTLGGQVIVSGAAAAVLVLETELYDTGNEYNPSTYKFTAGVAGYYHFAAALSASVAAALAIGDTIALNFYRNGVIVVEGPSPVSQAANGTRMYATLAHTILMAAGEYVEVRVSCSAQNFTTTKCFLTVDRL